MSNHDSRASITALLKEFGRGNRDVESRLAPLVYTELRRVAAAFMRRERVNHTLQPTALVNELWIRMAAQPECSFEDRVQFFAFAARLMRQVLVDDARKQKAVKRGGAMRQITLVDALAAERPGAVDVLLVDDAIRRLSGVNERAAQVVELHFFGGLTFEEMEELLKVSTRTLKRDWTMARAWLRSELSPSQ